MSKKIIKLRPEVESFAAAIEAKLQLHDEDRGETWKDDTIRGLFVRLEDEIREARDAYEDCDSEALASELVDVGAFARFIVDNLSRPRRGKRE